MELEWWKLLGQQTRQNPITAAEGTQALNSTSLKPKTDINFEAVGTIAGATIGFTIYVWTYPIVWIDGPLPVVDAYGLVDLHSIQASGQTWAEVTGRNSTCSRKCYYDIRRKTN